MNLFKRILPDIVVIILFAVISFAYFSRQWQKGVSFHNMTLWRALVPVKKRKNIWNVRESVRAGLIRFLVVCLLIRWHPVMILRIPWREWRSYIICISRIMCGMYLSCCWAFIYYCVHSISRSGWLHWGLCCGRFLLIFHHYSCRTHLEICNLGLYSTHYSRYGIGL